MDTIDGVAHDRPLADRMRPRNLGEFIGQGHLLAPQRPLRRLIEAGRLHSMVFWGPPGTGKTSLARLIALCSNARFLTLSAVLGGVREIRAAVEQARTVRAEEDRPTVLFVDEAHRFNKAQQDAFLPHVEDGTLVFVGATTENPSFELNNALLSRVRVYTLKALSDEDLREVLRGALGDAERGFGTQSVTIDEASVDALARAADGDARRALNLLETAVDLSACTEGVCRVEPSIIDDVTRGGVRRFDKGGDLFYDQISALHKSVRGSDPDAALYWLCRMLDGGCDPRYIARRVVRMAVEDVGNADPRGLRQALDAWEAFERLGSPEGDLAIGQAVIYLACTVKSNAAYRAFSEAMAAARGSGSLEVPVHLRNAPTGLARQLGHGQEYRYPHDEPEGFAAGQTYLPEGLQDQPYYAPVDRGTESRIRERLKFLREMNSRRSRDTDRS